MNCTLNERICSFYRQLNFQSLFEGLLNEGQDMQIEHFQTISKTVKGCHVRSVVVNSLIYLDAKWDGIVITAVHPCAETQPLSSKRQWLTASIRDSHRTPCPPPTRPCDDWSNPSSGAPQAGHGWHPPLIILPITSIMPPCSPHERAQPRESNQAV